VWSKCGSDLDKNLPVIRAEYLFPDVHDPLLILKAMNEQRKEWDQAKETIEHLA